MRTTPSKLNGKGSGRSRKTGYKTATHPRRVSSSPRPRMAALVNGWVSLPAMRITRHAAASAGATPLCVVVPCNSAAMVCWLDFTNGRTMPGSTFGPPAPRSAPPRINHQAKAVVKTSRMTGSRLLRIMLYRGRLPKGGRTPCGEGCRLRKTHGWKSIAGEAVVFHQYHAHVHGIGRWINDAVVSAPVEPFRTSGKS